MGEFPLWPMLASATSQTTEVESADGYTRMISKISSESHRSADGTWAETMVGVGTLLLDSPSSSVPQRQRVATELKITLHDRHAAQQVGGEVQVATSNSGMADEGTTAIVPVRKRRQNSLRNTKDSTEQLRKRSGAGVSSSVTSDAEGASAGRAGRNFTVGTVGTNGTIFLRPVLRPHQQQQQPPTSFVLPSDPSSTSVDGDANTEQDSGIIPRNGLRSGSRPPRTAHFRHNRSTSQNKQASWSASTARAGHHRARSFSSIDENQRSRASEDKVVIDRRDLRRPKTAGQGGLYNLEVKIPHYRLGTPRFNSRGSAILRSSAYTRDSATEDIESSLLSQGDIGSLFPVPPSMASPTSEHTPSSSCHGSQQPSRNSQKPQTGSLTLKSPKFHQPRGSITPGIYDAPDLGSDNPSVVRYASTTGEITAATLPRIISQITSANFLDYDMLSDFFLTFRSYLAPHHLVDYLIARLEWAVNRADESGRIVRVRTFVALRHWTLNYFMDDFVPDYSLRVYFCRRLNQLCESLRLRPGGGGGDLKIIHELRRCWRRTCALYWDIPEPSNDGPSSDEILPGGQVGSRNPVVIDASNEGGIAERLAFHGDSTPMPLQSSGTLDDWSVQLPPCVPSRSFLMDSEESGVQVNPTAVSDAPKSPISDRSIQVLSCSFPAKGLWRAQHDLSRSSAAHQVPISTVALYSATTTDSKKHSQPRRPHKRNGSFSDALRDTRSYPASQSATRQSAHALVSSPSAGSLIRGNLIAPGKPIVLDVLSSSLLNGAPPDNLSADGIGTVVGSFKPSLNPSPGVKKFIGSVRRAIGNKRSLNHVSTGPGGQFPYTVSTLDKIPNGMTHSTDRSNSSGRETSRGGGNPVATRVDFLAASVRENFQRKVREERDANLSSREEYQGVDGQSAFRREQSLPIISPSDGKMQPSERLRMRSQVTSGSHSIVIVNDTQPDLPSFSSAATSIRPHTPATDPDYARKLTLGPSHHLKPQNDDSSRAANGYGVTQDRNHQSLSKSNSGTDDPRAQLLHSKETLQRHPALQSSSPMSRSRSLNSARSASISLKRYASFQGARSMRVVNQNDLAIAAFNPGREFNSDKLTGGAPDRMLRRRPGGDLRAVHNVQDLEQIPRSQSTGSLTNYSGSVLSSILHQADAGLQEKVSFNAQAQAQAQSLSQQTTKPSLSLVHTHSSQPNLRPSFEAEVAKLARIPDNQNDDGGIESALLKLEGRFGRQSHEDTKPREAEHGEGPLSQVNPSYGEVDLVVNRPTQNPPPQTNLFLKETVAVASEDRRREGTSFFMSSPHDSLSVASVKSDDSCSSTPILERGITEIPMKPQQTSQESPKISVPLPLFCKNDSVASNKPTSADRMSGYADETSSTQKSSHRSKAPEASIAGDSFLLNEDEDFSDLSSELSAEDENEPNALDQTQNTFPSITTDKYLPEIGLFSHPLRHPPSPPPAIGESGFLLRPQEPRHSLIPPTPKASPPSHENPQISSCSRHSSKGSTIQPPSPKRVSSEHREPLVHLPFILGYDSELLAQQFTLIEKDALNEIDWRDLVDLRWRHSSPDIRDWVDFLKTEEPRGVEVVIARFNIIVKWALSECVLTQHLEERARVFIKYIHIAAHCRRYRNYATMYQITIALLSTDCSRLSKAWSLVPSADMQTLKQLEALVQPTRNFHNLRLEMETASPDEGCIPFVGIYTHDLMYNAQKPSQLPTADDGEPLINFERYRTSATIVKNLLRLLEASSRYTFKPNEEVISKGLWMAALPDAEIRKLSKELE